MVTNTPSGSGWGGRGGGRAGSLRRAGARDAESARGLIFIALLVAMLIMGISTTVAAPVWHTEVLREKEAELLFRLGQYRQAIARYRGDRGRPPRELKDLLEARDQLVMRRYLRRLYLDPMTGKDDWKVDLVADRTGAVLGISDIHSSSEKEPLRVFKDKRSYKDW